jgi:putative acetyltransferase
MDTLREDHAVILSLVAVRDTEIMERILCSPVTIASGPNTVEAVGLAPMAVMPTCQHQGIGCEYEVPADVFMVVALEPGALA